MSIQQEILKNLEFEYGKVTYTENKGLITYVIAFDYTAAPSLLTIEYNRHKSEISLVMSYAEDFLTLAKNNLDKSYKIRMYLDVFYAEPTVSIENGNMVISHTYSFASDTFSYRAFSNCLATVEKMTHEVNHMLTTKKFETDEYQDIIYGGGMFERLTGEHND